MFRKRVTFANVTAFLALFVALSAGSYAAIRLPANSVGSKQIKAKAVTSPKIRAGAIDGSKVKDGSLTGSDLNLTTLGKVPSAASADAAPIARVKKVNATGTSRPSGTDAAAVDGANVNCDNGLVVIGGGVEVSDPSNQFATDTFPVGTNGWSAHVANVGSGSPSFTVWALCAPAASTQ